MATFVADSQNGWNSVKYRLIKKTKNMKQFRSYAIVAVLVICWAVSLASCTSKKENAAEQTNVDLQQSDGITAEMAYEGVNNYCHSEYDWSVAKENPSIMYVKMEEGTDTEFKVVFRSYTGALVNFYVEKSSGKTRIVESVPSLGVEDEVGTINISDYLEKKK